MCFNGSMSKNTAPAATTGWQILGVFPSTNGQFKVIGRNGSRVAHVDRLTEQDAKAFTPADVEAFYRSGLRPATPNIVDLMATI